MRWADGRRWQANEFYEKFGPHRRRPFPILVFWRWRWELGATLSTYWLGWAVGPVTMGCALGLVAVVGLGWPPARAVLTARARAVIVQHRLRVGMVQAGVLSWSGWLPAILWTSPTAIGARVVLWCPAGVDVNAFFGTHQLLAAACWASEVRVYRHSRWANVVVLVVVARPGY